MPSRTRGGRPVTEADLKQAAYFGLVIPKPAPAPVAEVAPAIPAADPRDTCGPETDEFAWELGPEAAAGAPDFVAEPLLVVPVEVINLVSDARRLRRETLLAPADGAPTGDDESACPLP